MPRMKSLTVLMILLVAVSLSSFEGCTRVKPGHAAVKVSLAGDGRGINKDALTTGWVFYLPWATQVISVPTSVQNATWTKSLEEGAPINEEFTFNAKGGTRMTVDVSLAYQLIPDSLPVFYNKFLSNPDYDNNLAKFTNIYVHNIARNVINVICARYTFEEMYDKKQEIMDSVEIAINSKMAVVGFNVGQLGVIGDFGAPPEMVASLNSKNAATQNAIRSQNEVAQAEAEAQKLVARTKGQADSTVAVAEGAKRSAQAQADANRILAGSISPQLIEWRKLELAKEQLAKWDGTFPQFMPQGSSPFMFNLPQVNK